VIIEGIVVNLMHIFKSAYKKISQTLKLGFNNNNNNNNNFEKYCFK